MLHCIKQNDGAGGASIFSDGLAAAEALSKSDPTGFELLCTLPVLYDDLDPREQKDRRYHLEAVHPVLQRNPATGQCVALHVNNGVRSSLLASASSNTQELKDHYKALGTFRVMLDSPTFLFEQLAHPGDVWIFDNRRVLHGRRGLTAGCRERHLEGGYVEWDDLRSLLRLVSAPDESAHVAKKAKIV
jgi:gamma-butyrobetaine dioxygenase